MDMDKSSSPDTFWGHFTASVFLIGFGSSFLALTAWRWTRLERFDEKDRVRVDLFLERHIPEKNPLVLLRTSYALIFSTTFGLLYEGLGARFLNHDLHPDWTVFHYTTHLTHTVLFLWAGWTGLLEYWQLVPQDSLRAAVAVALFGGALLWHEHSGSKMNEVDARIHDYLALISLLTALCLVAGLLADHGTGSSFALYVGGFWGIDWLGVWFMVAAFHQTYPIQSTEHITAIFCLSGAGLLCALQVVVILLPKAGTHNSDKYRPVSTPASTEVWNEEDSSSEEHFLTYIDSHKV